MSPQNSATEREAQISRSISDIFILRYLTSLCTGPSHNFPALYFRAHHLGFLHYLSKLITQHSPNLSSFYSHELNFTQILSSLLKIAIPFFTIYSNRSYPGPITIPRILSAIFNELISERKKSFTHMDIP